jgi:hypothetical protein
LGWGILDRRYYFATINGRGDKPLLKDILRNEAEKTMQTNSSCSNFDQNNVDGAANVVIDGAAVADRGVVVDVANETDSDGPARIDDDGASVTKGYSASGR